MYLNILIYSMYKSHILIVLELNILQMRLKNLLENLKLSQIFLEYKHLIQ